MQAATVEVPNPDARRKPFATHYRGVTTYVEPKEFRIRLPQNLRDDPIGQMHRKGQLGSGTKADIMLDAARQLQETHERAGSKLRSSGNIVERVDGGQIAVSGPSEPQMKAARTMALWQVDIEAEHGKSGWRVIIAVLVDKNHLKQCAQRFYGGSTRVNEIYVGRILREALGTLATSQGRG